MIFLSTLIAWAILCVGIVVVSDRMAKDAVRSLEKRFSRDIPPLDDRPE